MCQMNQGGGRAEEMTWKAAVEPRSQVSICFPSPSFLFPLLAYLNCICMSACHESLVMHFDSSVISQPLNWNYSAILTQGSLPQKPHPLSLQSSSQRKGHLDRLSGSRFNPNICCSAAGISDHRRRGYSGRPQWANLLLLQSGVLRRDDWVRQPWLCYWVVPLWVCGYNPGDKA